MPIQAFSFPIPETRFFQVGQHVYKFKIRRGNKIRGEEEILHSGFVSEELENAVRVVLMSLENLHPFSTQHFNIFPSFPPNSFSNEHRPAKEGRGLRDKSRWERVSELRFRKGDQTLFAYPFLITLYVETNEPILALTVNHANKRVPSDRKSRLYSPQLPISCTFPPANEPKRRRTEEPQEGALSSDHHYDKVDAHLCLQELANLSQGAEEMVCGTEVYADSEESSESDSKSVIKQDAPDPKSTEREEPGVLARLASIAAFPFSLLFRRS